MSTLSFSPAFAGAPEQAPPCGLLQRMFAALVKSRTATAERRISTYLRQLEPARLHGLGLTEAEIWAIHAGDSVAVVLARRGSATA